MKCAKALWLGVWAVSPASLVAQRSVLISPEFALQRSMGQVGSLTCARCRRGQSGSAGTMYS